jgi:O-antigen ligase
VFFGFAASAVLSIQKLAVFFVLLGWFFMAIKFFSKSVSLPNSIVLSCIFFVYIIVSSFWSPLFSFLSMASIFTIFMSSFLIFLVVYNKIITIDSLILILMIPGAVNLVCYLLNINIFIVGHDGIEATESNAMQRFGGLTGHPNSLAIRAILPLLLVGIFYKNLTCKNASKIILILLAISLSLFAVIATGSKKSIFLTFIALYLLIINIKLGKLIINYCFIFVSLICLYFVSDFNVDVLINSDINALSRFGYMIAGDDESTAERLYMQAIAPKIFLDHFIFGAGLNGFSFYSSIGAYAHNNYLELSASAGILGLSMYYFSFITHLIYGFIFKGFYWFFGVFSLFMFIDLTSVVYMDRTNTLLLFLFYLSVLEPVDLES